MKDEKLPYLILKELPSNILAEEAILNILLTNPTLIKITIPQLKASNFYFNSYRLIYEIIIELHQKNYSITSVSLITILQDRDLFEKIGGSNFINNLLNKFENPLALQSYIGDIKEKSWRRSLIHLGHQIIEFGYKTSENFEYILRKIDEQIFFLNQQNSSQKIYTSAQIIDDVFEEIKLKIQKNESVGFLSSFKDLDSLLQGLQKSDLIVIAGRPSMGKTAFALNLGKNIVEKYKIPLIIFTLEMSREQVVYRFLSAESNINSTRLRTGKMSQLEWYNLGLSMKKIAKLPIYIDDSSTLSISEIRLKLKSILGNKKAPGLVIIDYLQLMNGNEKSGNRVQEISAITRNLKILAKEFEIPIILLSQLSRNVESRVNKRPLLSDLRESGSIEQDADIVIMLYREEYYNQKLTTTPLTELNIIKHRNGEIGTVRLKFNPYTTTFENAKNQT